MHKASKPAFVVVIGRRKHRPAPASTCGARTKVSFLHRLTPLKPRRREPSPSQHHPVEPEGAHHSAHAGQRLRFAANAPDAWTSPIDKSRLAAWPTDLRDRHPRGHMNSNRYR